MQIETKKILQYLLTPQFMPRLSTLFYTGFTAAAFFMAQIYRAVGLLPAGHPYLRASNMGRFGVRHVIAEAGNHIVFKKENIDQILIYVMTLTGMVLLACQIFMLFVAGFVDIAHAAGVNIFAGTLYASSSPLDFFTFFQTPSATNDIAFVLLDRIFGIPGTSGAANSSFFTDAGGGYTCVAQGNPCFTGLANSTSTREFTPDRTVATSVTASAGSLVTATTMDIGFPWPYHEALRGMIQIYSVGLLVIGIFIFCYFMFAIAAETAQTGTAFGKRFNHLWAPIRMVLAIGLLVPITYGLNPAQWILMYAAKWGSSFATNAWIVYNNSFSGTDTLLGPRNTVIATPHAPQLNTLLEFASILGTCKEAYERLYYEKPTRPRVVIDAWLVNPQNLTLAPQRLLDVDYPTALEYFNYGTIVVRFGELRTADDGTQTWDGMVAPWCGEVTLDQPFVSPDHGATTVEPGSWFILSQYFQIVYMIWEDIYNGTNNIGTIFPSATLTFGDIGEKIADRHISVFNNKDTNLPTNDELRGLREGYEQYLDSQIALAVQEQRDSGEWAERLEDLGWAGAAIWYNKIAQLNGGLVSAVYSMPAVKLYPYAMEEVRKKRAASDSGVSGETSHRVYRGTDDLIPMEDETLEAFAKAFYQAEIIWHDNYSETQKSSNAFIDAINMVFGTEGLFNITTNEAQNIHPLAQLAAIGRSIVDSAIRNMGYSTVAGLGGGLANLFQEHEIGKFGGTISSFFFQVAMTGLSLGFVLFYVIPILPFIYFFFAVGGWIKSIFEAMVGVPLWALAHIRIDGEGLPGDAAMGGYYLILEIFLRPILTIFGFIAGMMIFTAQVQILHEVWSLVVTNVSGTDTAAAVSVTAGETGSINYVRGAVDKLFFTVMYAILCYMLAMGSFKLIDQVPNHLLRWMGASVSPFGAEDDDPAQNLVRNSFIGTRMIGSPLKQAAGSAVGAGKQSSAALGDLFSRSKG